jgi:lipoate-protein ligase A
VEAEVVPLVRERSGPAPTFCFARTGAYEITVAGRKLAGSAQRRQGGGFLQHGSLLLDADPERLRAVFPRVADPLAGITTVAAVLGRRPGFDEVAEALGAGLAGALGPLRPGGLSPGEVARAERLVAEKYATEPWTREGRLPASAHA